uniref:NADH-ubiquinone oxidoreductase chain 3 n=1 Tax=Russelliana solanicola TaxID=2008469 RepID=A0A344A2R6_9HEMI|nr:NADH dehydrogenase subunit 3 [Russelliana solanicola]AWU49057.1 NADH dehydrogenase subunit 3 [Russelliana solanicola]
MYIILMLFMVILLLLIAIISIIPLINVHKFTNRDKTSPFECGFDPFKKPRLPFSIQFFCISLMFLIFDIEMTLILPIPLLKFQINLINWTVSSSILITLLMLGLILEWKEGSMNWM